MQVVIELTPEQCNALLRWMNNDDDLPNPEGCDIVHDLDEIESTLQRFINDSLKEI